MCRPKELAEKYLQSDVKIIFALYKPEVMKERVSLLKSYGIHRDRFTNFIHPSAYVAKSVRTGAGNVILANTAIHANVWFGNFNIINTNVVVEHDTKIESFNFIAASSCIGSHVTISNGVFIGMNASIRENLTVEDFAFIGMGSNVTRHVKPDQLVYGNPAKPKAT
ncbi:MAG: acetyltransferase [bacterium]